MDATAIPSKSLLNFQYWVTNFLFKDHVFLSLAQWPLFLQRLFLVCLHTYHSHLSIKVHTFKYTSVL